MLGVKVAVLDGVTVGVLLGVEVAVLEGVAVGVLLGVNEGVKVDVMVGVEVKITSKQAGVESVWSNGLRVAPFSS